MSDVKCTTHDFSAPVRNRNGMSFGTIVHDRRQSLKTTVINL